MIRVIILRLIRGKHPFMIKLLTSHNWEKNKQINSFIIILSLNIVVTYHTYFYIKNLFFINYIIIVLNNIILL